MLLLGKPVSPGVAQGLTHVVDGRPLLTAAVSIAPLGNADVELQRLRDGLDLALAQLERVQRQLYGQLDPDDVAIFSSHGSLLRDRHLIQRIEQRIRDGGVSAEAAVGHVVGELYQQFLSNPVSLLQDKAHDLLDIGRRLLQCLSSGGRSEDEPVARKIVVANSVTPSELVRFARQGVVGIVTETCGHKSHTAILARGLGIPLITGIHSPAESIPDGVASYIDAAQGRVLVAPTSADHSLVDQFLAEIERGKQPPSDQVDAPVTRDGVRIQVLLNISDPSEARGVRDWQTDGVGLFRTEFLYIDRPGWLTPDESYAIYKQVGELVGDRELHVRLTDFGAEKCPAYADIPISRNPSLGLRGIRLLLQRPDILQAQVVALTRLARERPLSVTLPMLDTLDTLHQAYVEICRFAGVSSRDKLPFRLGTMIEVPSAALMIEDILPHVDCISVGLNDLIQYLFAADRDDEAIERYHDPMQPALLRLLRRVIDACNATGKPLTVCGELAGDPSLTALLISLGVRRFSVSRTNYLATVQLIRTLSCAELDGLATDVLRMVSGNAVRNYVAERFGASREEW
jgi:phosphoenolpyruvate-protein phosphotransferase (PTS system enzyme I)